MKKWQCQVCGYIYEGEEPPDKCPVCGADKSLFDEVGGQDSPAPAEPDAEKPAQDAGKKWRCQVCGYIHEGPEPPDKCPVCSADKSMFEEITEDASPKSEAKTTEKKQAKPAAKKTETPKAAPASPGTGKKWRCTVCGYIHNGPKPPDKCPACGADKSLFEEVTAGSGDSGAEEAPAGVDLGPVPETKAGRYYYMAVEQILKHHAHPVSVHIPNGVIPFSFLFILLAAVSGCDALVTAAKYNMFFVVLALPLVLFTGYIEWQKRYRGALTDRFAIKIVCAVIVTVLAVCVVVWWIVNPEILASGSPGRWIFILINAVMLGAAGVAGFIGGKFVFKD